MEILKTAIDWAKAEVFSSQFFIFFAVLFLLAAIGFWQIGKTEMAKAFIIPSLVAGSLLLAVGVGILFTNKSRVASFENDYNNDAAAFVESEIIRTEKSMGEYQLIVFKIIPLIIILASLLVILIDKPSWRATCTTIIAMMIVILLVDHNANARIEAYHNQLEEVKNQQ